LISVGAPLQTPLGELTALRRSPTWILGVLLLREARGGGEKGKGRGRDGRQALSLPLPNSLRHWASRPGEPFAASGTLGDLTWLEDFLTSK